MCNYFAERFYFKIFYYLCDVSLMILLYKIQKRNSFKLI